MTDAERAELVRRLHEWADTIHRNMWRSGTTESKVAADLREAASAIESSPPIAQNKPHEEMVAAGTLYSDAKLVWRAMCNCRVRGRHGHGKPLSNVVQRTFGCGSNLAVGLCKRFGYDPNEEIK